MKISQGYLHNMLILLENTFRVANNLPSRVIDNSQVHQYCSFDNEKKNLCDRRWSSGGHNSFDTRCKRTRRNACGAWRRADTLAETLAVVETIDEIRAQLKTPLLELDSVLWKQYPYPSR
jgi:hypothetical protein